MPKRSTFKPPIIMLHALWVAGGTADVVGTWHQLPQQQDSVFACMQDVRGVLC